MEIYYQPTDLQKLDVSRWAIETQGYDAAKIRL